MRTDPDAANARRAWRALHDFGAPAEALGISLADLSDPAVVTQLGMPPKRIDVMTSVSGIASFADAWASRVVRPLGPVPDVPFLGREHLVANTSASARLKDLADVESLESPEVG